MSRTRIPPMILAALAFATGATAADLRPDQQAAVEQLLATVDPAARDMARPTIEQSIVALTPEQVAMVVAGASRKAAGSRERQPAVEASPRRTATAEDLAHNRAQFEPALRQHWEAKRAFDQFVDAELRAKCPARDTYAVYREAERYELMPLSPEWHRATDNAQAEITVYGENYPPKDGRYAFDFSKVRMTFDKAAVSAAIAQACADWSALAADFKAKAAQLMNSGQSQAAFTLERSTNAKVSPLNERLAAVIAAQSPGANFNQAMLDALRKPRRID